MDIEILEQKAFEIRADIIRSLAASGSGHLGGSLGIADLLTYLYFEGLNHDPSMPNWSGRDKFILSAGHLAPALYASLAHAGYFPKEELMTLRKFGSRLQGHPGRDHGLPGLELSAGSLGQGLSVSVGMALQDRMDHFERKIVCLMGDGEVQEGSVWEAAMSASHHKLSQILVIIDRNGVQIDGHTEDVMAIDPLADKWLSFGWKVFTCNGHDFQEIDDAFRKGFTDRPVVLIANTSMGKGVQSIEGDYRWHGKAPDREQSLRFLRELSEAYDEIR